MNKLIVYDYNLWAKKYQVPLWETAALKDSPPPP